MKKVLLDTDIGNDIDDAIALAYLLKQPECDLIGITTVSGRSDLRASMCSVLCKAADKDVPIFAGTQSPLLTAQRQPMPYQAKMLEHWAHDTFSVGGAVAFMRDAIRANPGEISLLSIGPMTNIALLFALDEEIPHLLKELVIMGGSFSERLPNVGRQEWNILCDPYAAQMVYQAPVAVHRSVGIDITMQVFLKKEELVQRFTTPLLRPVLDFAGVWFEHASAAIFHDPLTTATLFADVCTFVPGRVTVELHSDRLSGYTHFDGQAQPALHQVAADVQPEAYFRHFFDVMEA